MSKNVIDKMPENRVVYEINELKRQILEIKSNQSQTIYKTQENAIQITINPGRTAKLNASLHSNTPNTVVLGIPEISIYKGTSGADVSTANLYPIGINWSPPEIIDFHLEPWFDWGSSDGLDLNYAYVMKNSGANVVDVFLVIRWRFLRQGSS